MSNALKVAILNALADWAQWVSAGSPSNNEFEFDRYFGICSNVKWHPELEDFRHEVFPALSEMFQADGLNGDYPFNHDRSDYISEAGRVGINKNPARLEWVRKTLQAAGQ